MTAPYATGTITLTNGSNVITGTGTGWQTSLVVGGIVYPEAANGNAMPIVTVDTDTKITAATKWKGASGTYPYAIMRDTAYGQQTVANAQALAAQIQRLNNPMLAALAALSPVADKVVSFGENAETALADLSTFGKSLIASLNSSAAYGALGVIPNAQLPDRLKAFPEYVADWNNVREAGEYFGGPDTANTPAQPYVFVGKVEPRESAYVVQKLTAVGISNPALNVKFERQIVNNVPSAWTRVRTTEVELDARYNRLSQPVANSQLPERLRPNGRVITDWNNATESGVYFGETAANCPPGIDGGLIGYVDAASADGAVVQTVVRWWGITATVSATWRRAKQGPDSWTTWVYQLTNRDEMDARYNRQGVAIPKDQLPNLMNATSFIGEVQAGVGDVGFSRLVPGSTTFTGYFDFWQPGGTRAGYVGAANSVSKVINLTSENGYTFGFFTSGGRYPTVDGQDIRTAATAYAKSETYTQAQTQSLVTTARQVRLAGLGEIAATVFQWNEAAAGCVLTGVFLDGNWGVRNYRYRAIQQTDVSGNWVTVAQA